VVKRWQEFTGQQAVARRQRSKFRRRRRRAVGKLQQLGQRERGQPDRQRHRQPDAAGAPKAARLSLAVPRGAWRVAAHAYGAAGINATLEAGVESIEHGSFLDARSLELFIAKGAFHVPTIIAGVTVLEMAQGDGLLATAQIEKAMIVGVKIKEALADPRHGEQPTADRVVSAE